MAEPTIASGPSLQDGENERFLKRFRAAKQTRDRVASIIDDCYEFALPLRERVYQTDDSARRTDRLFDGTAPEALQGLASQIFDDVWPADSKPFELLAGRDIDPAQRDEVNRALSEVATDIIETINNSDFEAAAQEMLLDWGISTGVLLVEAGDAVEPLRNTCLPLSQAILDVGPFSRIDALFRERELKYREIRVVFPDAKISADIYEGEKNRPDEKLCVIEGVERDWKNRGTERWSYRCLIEKQNHTLKSGAYEGDGSCPFVAPSFMRVAGETYGRGPVQIALPDIKTLNLVKELNLENADLAMGGMWQLEDDGTVNADTITIAPGTIIPKSPGSKGLEPINFGGDFNLAQLLVQDLQQAIRRALFWNDLGPLDQTPRSATEILQRSSDLARRRRGPFGRLLTELLFPYVRRVAHIRKMQGAIKLPAIDGKVVRLRPLSPLTRAQAQDDILRHDRFIEMLNARFGPQTTQLLVDVEKYGPWLAAKFGVEPNLVRSQIERAKLAQAMAQAAAMAAAANTNAQAA